MKSDKKSEKITFWEGSITSVVIVLAFVGLLNFIPWVWRGVDSLVVTEDELDTCSSQTYARITFDNEGNGTTEIVPYLDCDF